MNKADLINVVAESTGMTKKDAGRAIDAVLDTITGSLKKGDKVQLMGFGTFEIRQRAAKKGLNPLTKQPITIPATKAVAFKAGKALKDSVK
ncbi:MAG TPA: HU family DNA-binding protein [Clostridia bacterium]|nr:HU family DNA-binding protein [Clostridia bacterium]